MNAVIKGAKAGEKKARQPKIAPDSAQSKTYIKILHGLSEGEVEGLANGLQSVYLEDTPLQNPDGGWNFEDVQADFRYGSNDQTYIEGFPDISSESAVGVELKSDAPWVRAISNTDLDALNIRFKWGPLRQQNAKNGDVNGYTIKYAIDLQTDGGTWTEVLNTQISDKTSANYERSHRIDLPKADTGWTVRVRRITPNSTSEYISDKMYVEANTEVIDLKLSYPNTALLGLQYDAETFSNVAKVAVDLKGIKVQVPSNYDPVARTYTGMWDGTFKRAYTNNPAWIYYDICTAKRYALGDRLTSAMLDKWSLYRLAQYCDQMVSDGKGGQEPRFTCNVYLQSTEDAYTILSKLAGVFRAISYWDGNSIVCDADIPQDTYFTYTRANVIDGLFEYSGTRARDRHTVAKVAWDNPKNRYKTEYVYVRDEAAIAKLGVRIAEIDAWGCTSEGQAQRAGLWALKSEQLETRTVSFKVGLDGYIPQPGRIIEISDELLAGRANGGRISSVSADLKTITIDRDDVVCHAGDRLVVNGEDGKAQGRIVSSINGRNITVTVAFDSVAAENVWAVDAQDLKTMKFRVMSITQDDKHQFSITALQYESAKYDAIDFGAFIDERPISIINPTVQAPVESVSITSETMVQQGLSVETMIITWPQVQGATKYQVEWRKDDGSWIKLPITGSNSIEVAGIYAGNYEARVTAISAFDMSSLPTYSNLTELSGKQGLPPSLAFLHADGLLFGMKLTWGFPATGALDTAYTEIQVSPDGVANIAQLGLFAYPTTTHSIQGMQPNLTQKYRGRLIDRIGNIGPWSEWATGTTSADASAVLDLLSDKITESQLSQDLKTEISKISDLDEAFAGVVEQVNEVVEGQSSLAQTIETVQTSVGEYVASVQEISESVDGLYAQKYTKIDVNGKVIGWGGANDGVEGQYVFNVDSLAIGSGDSAGYYPFNFRATAYTDPVTGTVFPVGAYIKAGFLDYASIDTANIKALAVTTAQIADAAITTAKIGAAQVDTLQIKGEAVTVPTSISNENEFSAFYSSDAAPNGFEANLSYWENLFGTIATITINRSGGKVRFDATLSYLDSSGIVFWGQNPSALTSAELYTARAVLSIYRGSTLVGRSEIAPNGMVNTNAPIFTGTFNMLGVIDESNLTGSVTYTLKFGLSNRLARGGRVAWGSSNGYFKVRSPKLIVTEMKR
ncbi:phage tail protein [Acinetobacter schindleri]|uniref:host specificity protein J n=1 Tax=Acinetobacter schindleri TaxID=108981 RepID=UPI003A8BB359